MAEAATSVNTTEHFSAIATNTATSRQQGQPDKRPKSAPQRAEKRARNRVTRAGYRRAQDAYVQEVLQEKRMEDMLTSMGRLGFDKGKQSKSDGGMTGKLHSLETLR